METKQQTPAQALKAWRESEGLSQEDAAPRLECSQQTVGALELGTRAPGLALALKIQEVTGIDAARWAKRKRAA